MKKVRVRSRSRSRSTGRSRRANTPRRNRSRSRSRGPGRPGGSGGGGSQKLSLGDVRFHNVEVIAVIETDSSGECKLVASLDPVSNSKMAAFNRIAKIYDLIKWHSATIEYIAAVGSDEGGIVAIGAKWAPDTKVPTDMQSAVACEPHMVGPPSKNRKMSLPVASRQHQNLIVLGTEASAVAELKIWAKASAKAQILGYVNITYDVTLSGMKSA